MVFQSRKRFRHCWSIHMSSSKGTNIMFQSRKRFRHCWSSPTPPSPTSTPPVSIAKAIPSLLEPRETATIPTQIKRVSIAKAIPSLLERVGEQRLHLQLVVSIAKAIPSLLERSVSANCASGRVMFQSRKRFRHCWSQMIADGQLEVVKFQSRKRFRHCWSLLTWQTTKRTPAFQSRKRFRHCWSAAPVRPSRSRRSVSIAKAIPSLLELRLRRRSGTR